MQRIAVIALLMITMIGSTLPVSVFAADDALPEAGAGDMSVPGPVVFADEEQLGTVKRIRVSFPDSSDEMLEWDFPYTNRLFSLPSEEFSVTMARASLGLTVSAFRTDADSGDPRYETYLRKAGFTNIYSFGYDKPPREDSLSGVIGMKRIGDCTVIAAAACGQGYGNEWASNFKVGNGERHEGFAAAARLFEDHLTRYLNENKIEGRKKLWVTGFSRASAIGNILAADMIESCEFEDVYAYLFGVPRTTRQPVRYKGIYNICGQYDPVPSVPLPAWGYERYGTDLYTPAQESNADYTGLALSAKEIGLKLDGKGFRNNPELNYQLRLILESFGEFFPDSEVYCVKMQGLLAEAIVNSGEANVFDLLTEAFEALDPKKSQDRAKADTFTDYLGYIVGQHLRADQRQVDDGSWDPDEPLMTNIALEHLPVTYVRWLFSEEEPQKIFSGPVVSRRLSLIGQVDVTVLQDGRELTRIDRLGRVSYPLEEGADGTDRDPGVFMMRNEKVTVVSLPNDTEYRLRIDADDRCSITFYDLTTSPEDLSTEHGKMVLATISAGSYGFTVSPGREIPSSPDVISGHYTLLGSSDYDYSPTAVMSDELEATRHYFMSLRRVYRLVINVAVGLIVYLLACLILHLVHRHLEKKGHPPFSKWYVIMPHLTTIAGLTILTGMLTYHLFMIDKVRIICASFTVLTIFLLSLRGTLRYKRKSSILLTTFLFLLFAITFLFFDRTEKLPFSWVSMTLFALAVGLLSAAAVRTFREPHASA